MPNNDEHKVETTVYLWEDLCNAADKMRVAEMERGPIVYYFGGGVVTKREGLGPYGPWE